TDLVESLLEDAGGDLREQSASSARRRAEARASAVQMKLLLAAYAPLWKQAETLTFAATFGERLLLEWVSESRNESDARAVHRTIDALRTLGRNMRASAAAMAKEQAAGLPVEPLLNALVKLAEELLDRAELEHEGSRVRLATSGTLGSDEANAVGVLAESVKAARAAARRTMSRNNLHQIGIAFHNYHDVYNRFPPAVLYGPDGKTPHTWRVAILPFIDQARLYEQYRFDEPWDSPHNKQILEQMPATYRHPDAPAGSTHSSYFGLVGEETIFTGKQATRNEAGVPIREILDGTSNTLMVVEAQRDIPWTKPEDIPVFDPDKRLPALGGYTPGGFQALFCDGATRFISEMIDAAVLKALLTCAGGEPVDLEALDAR
ncbi:MAG TPA: DUF1559 domain-containing protein, partial [Planctomycetaceae bacterium]|nr:DUF1559 domain-containing protein [Planctomycetaceae bacterium]